MLKKSRKTMQGFLAVLLLLVAGLTVSLPADAAESAAAVEVQQRGSLDASFIAYEIPIEDVAATVETGMTEEIRIGARTSDTMGMQIPVFRYVCSLMLIVATVLLSEPLYIEVRQRRKRVSKHGGQA